MMSQFFLLSQRGDTLAFRDFRGDVVRGTPEIFYRRIKLYKDATPPPIFHVEGTQFLHIIQAGLYFVCTTTSNVSPVYMLELLKKIALVCKDYCGVLHEEAIRCNFALIYEILDEILDFGYPQCTSTEVLKDYVFNEAYQSKQVSSRLSKVGASGAFGAERSVPSSAPNKSVLVSQTKTGGKNEVFIDILERLTVITSATGHVIRSEIDGCIKVQSFLAGSPEISLGLNENLRIRNSDNTYDAIVSHEVNSVMLDDCHLNECIDSNKFENSHCLVFRPSGGECVVMTYHMNGDTNLPFIVHPFMEVVSDKQITLQVKLLCDVPKLFNAVCINVSIPAPKTTTEVTHEASTGIFEYKTKEKVLTWSIKRMNGGSELNAYIKFTVPIVTNMSKKELGPISLDFEFPMYVCSKLQIKYLKVIERNAMYTPMRWVRYITHSDSYVRRL